MTSTQARNLGAGRASVSGAAPQRLPFSLQPVK